MIQLDFFQDDEIVILKYEMKKLKESNDKVRKSLFAKHGELAKNYMDLLQRMEILERHICTTTPQIINMDFHDSKVDSK